MHALGLELGLMMKVKYTKRSSLFLILILTYQWFLVILKKIVLWLEFNESRRANAYPT